MLNVRVPSGCLATAVILVIMIPPEVCDCRVQSWLLPQCVPALTAAVDCGAFCAERRLEPVDQRLDDLLHDVFFPDVRQIENDVWRQCYRLSLAAEEVRECLLRRVQYSTSAAHVYRISIGWPVVKPLFLPALRHLELRFHGYFVED